MRASADRPRRERASAAERRLQDGLAQPLGAGEVGADGASDARISERRRSTSATMRCCSKRGGGDGGQRTSSRLSALRATSWEAAVMRSMVDGLRNQSSTQCAEPDGERGITPIALAVLAPASWAGTTAVRPMAPTSVMTTSPPHSLVCGQAAAMSASIRLRPSVSMCPSFTSPTCSGGLEPAGTPRQLSGSGRRPRIAG
jgi:hypothetical protein